ncbi:E3 ubiquitin-protein ligase SINA-like 10 isoform X2 [Mangifera indica]|uniref:E3 ubiquitin-protein ligase SINA-like 10 isoform X2 n=1 Tax=Mangifera indica TaxID=29780 RepID=UPI001CFA3191|nr:E3 ubiquitin-protein ligase SINA-like 10 isoform X2 [Mangifera indica]
MEANLNRRSMRRRKMARFRRPQTNFREEIPDPNNNIDGNLQRNDVVGLSLPFRLTNPEVFDCPICFEPLTPPVFQCENGHISCSSCSTKLTNRCASCFCNIAYRNRAVEKILESVIISCQNAIYGCRSTMTYQTKHEHEKTCMYLPCSCPLSDCIFVGSSSQLYKHYRDNHEDSAVKFQYNHNMQVTLKADEKFLVLQEEEDGVLFILYNKTERLGNVILVSCIGTGSQTWNYDILSRMGTSATTLNFQSTCLCAKDLLDDPLSVFGLDTVGFLVVPSNFIGSCGKLELVVCIWRPDATAGELDLGLFNRVVNIA